MNRKGLFLHYNFYTRTIYSPQAIDYNVQKIKISVLRFEKYIENFETIA